MKKIIYAITFLLISVSVSSQTFYGKDAQAIIPGAELVVIDAVLNTPSFIHFAKDSEVDYRLFQGWLTNHVKISQDFGLKLIKTETDELGFTHYRYQQTYKSIPIHSNIFVVHVKSGAIESMNGQLFSTMDVPATASLTEAQALNYALTFVGADSYKWQIVEEEALLKTTLNDDKATYFPKGELMMVPTDRNFKGTNLRLTYRFDIYAHHPMSRQWVFVDAITGKVILTLNRIMTENTDVNVNASATAATKYSGTRTIMTDYTGTTYRLRETGRGLGIETYNLALGTNYGTATDFTNATTTWTDTNAAQDEVARDAHWGTEKTWDYYSLVHSRNSIDNLGFKLLSYVHADLVGMGYTDNVNAFWDGTRMTYGDGDGTYSPLTTLDICGHEITHGLTSNTANLNYQDESGALNEGFSDIFGTSIEFYAKPPLASGNWTIGEQIGGAFRDMSNPNADQQPDTYNGTYWYAGTGDNGGVHTNSGVVNYWYYLLCQGGSGTNDIGNAYSVTGITMAKAEKIAFRTLTVYLTSSSTYADARVASLQACADIYGGCSAEAIAVIKAWYAVGVGAAYVASPTHADFTACPVTQCTNAPFNVQFSNISTSANTYKWYFGDGNSSTLTAPANSYATNGTFNVKLVAYGGTCGSDSITKNAFISVGPAYPCQISVPATGTGTTQTSCTGNLYDSGLCGDYTDNTSGTITLSPTGATSVTITFNSFSFESGYDYLYVYNGPNTASPQFTGSPFSGNTLPGPLTSTAGSITIRQTSDQGVVASGFSLNWTCATATSPPVPAFVANTTTSCTGTIGFTDQSTNLPIAWLWKFGDGQTSTLQNPTHTYAANGVYTVKLKATNIYGNDSLTKTSYINISMPAGPIGTGATICTGQTAHLAATGSGILKWYATQTSAPLLQTGATYTTPVLSSTTNFWVKDSVSGTVSHAGKIDSVGGGSIFTSNTEHYEIFDTYIPLVLQTVKVYSSTAGTRTINLKNSAGVVLATATPTLVVGINTVILNFSMPVATGLRLAGPATTPNMYRNYAGFSYPITLAGKLAITGSSAGATLRYYYFYDWVVKETDCVSPRVMVTAMVNTCTSVDERNSDATIKVYPNPAVNFVNIDIGKHLGEQATIEIYNLQGQKLYLATETDLPAAYRKTIDVSTFAKGVYFLRITTGSKTTYRKMEVY
ncbi:MAG: M4 family metallopeptidase [Bacteroidota bacterium]